MKGENIFSPFILLIYNNERFIYNMIEIEEIIKNLEKLKLRLIDLGNSL